MAKLALRDCLRVGAAAGILAASPGTPSRVEAAPASAPPPPTRLATGQLITPMALRGAHRQFLNPGLPGYPSFVAGEAVRSQLSPDGRTLVVLCAGQNSLYKPDGTVDATNSTQFLFFYDVSAGHEGAPVLKQVIQQKNSHVGLVFSPDGTKLYAAGGKDDVVYAYQQSAGAWSLAGAISLGHGTAGLGLGVSPNASGLGISHDGRTLVVANNYNDSISVIDTATRAVRFEHDLRPFAAANEGVNGAAGGTFPFAVVVKHDQLAYVSSDRNREVVVVDVSGATSGRLVKRIKLDGNALGMTLDRTGHRLFVAEDNADQVAVIDTARNEVIAKIDARAPAGLLPGGADGDRDRHDRPGDDRWSRDRDHDHDEHGGPRPRYTGAAPFAVTLAPDGRTLYAVNAAANSIAVIPLHGERALQVAGLIPTAYEPHDVTFSADGRTMYVVNGKSVTGPNPDHLASATASITSYMYPGGNTAAAAAARASNEYQFQLERASLVAAPVPGPWELEPLTARVAANNFYGVEAPADERVVMEFLRRHIKHVIYVVKENRTFDQILGDLTNGANADASLVQFGEALTPNFHRLARRFVTLDNFMDPGDGSMDGWSWALQGRVTNTETITQQINYAAVSRGLSYESEGTNRNVPVNWATVSERDAVSGPPGTTKFSDAAAALPGGAANLLAGPGNHASSDAPFGGEDGYIFSAVLKAGGTVRNYGFLVNNVGSIGTITQPVSDPFAAGQVQVAPLDPALAPVTDLYFRGYDQNYPDLWRFNEWKREFDQYVAGHDLPSLSLVRVSHDHMGSFGSALAGVNTPETQQADDDLAVGRMIETVSHSPYAHDTLIIVTEDDCQDGPDHVDSHRATAYIAGPYVKRAKVVSTPYSQVNVLRTIEDVLGTQHINLNTASQRPLTDVFDIRQPAHWSYEAVASTVLKGTALEQTGAGLGAALAEGPVVRPKHGAAYWARMTKGLDFSEADHVPPGRFNRLLWRGLMGGRRYPAALVGRVASTDASPDDRRSDD